MVKDEPGAGASTGSAQDTAGENASNGNVNATTNTNSSPDKPARKRRLDVNPDLILSTSGRSKRRRTPTPPPDKPEADPQDVERARTLGNQIFNRIMNLKDEDGESMAEPFISLPSKDEFPDYYETIKHPMSLEMVQQKLDRSSYLSIGQVCADLGTIWNNAKRYNMSESLLFQWARHMHKITRNFLASHTHGHNGSDESDEDDEPPPPMPAPRRAAPPPAPAPRAHYAPEPAMASPNATAGPSTPQSASHKDKVSGPGTGRKRGSYMKDGPTVYKLIKPCMRAIKEAKSDDGSGREIQTAFLSLPDRRAFPDYYRMIKNPVTLTDIEHRMVSRRFDGSTQFFEEVERLCGNAQAYNQEGSDVWMDAQQIRGIVAQHREMVKDRLSQPRSAQSSKFGKTPTTSTPVRHPHMPVGLPTPTPVGQAPPLAAHPHAHQQHQQHQQHQMMLPPDIRTAYVQQQQGYAYRTPPTHSQQLPMHSPQQVHAQVSPAASYLPPLPHGIVTEEIVASLDRYPAYDQQAWSASLPPLAQTAYRQIVAVNEARKRGVAPPAPPEPARAPEPAAALNPTIKHIDFSYNANTLRLENVRGIVTHAVAIAAGVSGEVQLELTAWVDTDTDGDVPMSLSQKQPELVLKINGTPTTAAPTKVYGSDKEHPAAVRWSVPVKGSSAKLELVATKPGAHVETSAIYVNQQY